MLLIPVILILVGLFPVMGAGELAEDDLVGGELLDGGAVEGELVNGTLLVESRSTVALKNGYSLSVRSASYGEGEAWMEILWNDTRLMGRVVPVGGTFNYTQDNTSIIIVELIDVYIGGGEKLVQVHVVQNQYEGPPSIPEQRATPTRTPTQGPTPSMPGFTMGLVVIATGITVAIRRTVRPPSRR